MKRLDRTVDGKDMHGPYWVKERAPRPVLPPSSPPRKSGWEAAALHGRSRDGRDVDTDLWASLGLD